MWPDTWQSNRVPERRRTEQVERGGAMADAALRAELDRIFAARDRANMAPTIAAFRAVLAEHPLDAEVLYEVGGGYDTDGQEAEAEGFYRRAIAAGLEGTWLRQCFVQLGSTLRNLGRLEDSLAVFNEGLDRFPGSESLVLFRSLTLQALGRDGEALGSVITLITDRFPSDEVRRYEAALRGNAAELIADEAGARPAH